MKKHWARPLHECQALTAWLCRLETQQYSQVKAEQILAANTAIPRLRKEIETLKLQSSSLQSKRLEAAHRKAQQSLEKTKVGCSSCYHLVHPLLCNYSVIAWQHHVLQPILPHKVQDVTSEIRWMSLPWQSNVDNWFNNLQQGHKINSNHITAMQCMHHCIACRKSVINPLTCLEPCLDVTSNYMTVTALQAWVALNWPPHAGSHGIETIVWASVTK